MKFKIDLKIFIFVILFYFTKQIEIYAIIMLFAIIHELGHLISGIFLKMKPEKIEIMPFGVRITFKINTIDYNKKIKKGNLLEIKKMIVAMAGPLTNFMIISLIKFTKLDIIQELIIIYTNILILFFNLLPIYPLDGGRILKEILHILFGKQKAEKYINNISIIITVIITFIASLLIVYTKNIAIFLIISYIWFIVIRENNVYKRKEKLYKEIKMLKNNN